jgi:DHA1 family tetracycline resistance protein-like MFS transporter
MLRRAIPPHVFIYITAFLEMMSSGLAAPVLPRLLQELTNKGVAEAGISYGMLISAYAIAMVLTAKLMGRLSDAFGRRPVILIALAGSAIDFVVAALAPSLWVLLVARVVAGCCGATLVVCNAYIIDVTPQDQRAVRFGMLRGVLAAGMTLGPVIGGVLGAHDTRAPFWAAAALTGLSALYGMLALPESLKPEDRRPFSWVGALPFSIPRLSGLSVPVGVLVTLLLFELGTSLAQPITVLYTQLRFGWTPRELGLFLGVGGILSVFGQAGLTRLLVPRLGEPRAVLLGLSVFALTLVLYGVVSAPWQLYGVLLIAQFGFIGIPALMSLISRYTSNSAQGEVVGLLVALSTSAQVVAPLLGTWLFSEFSERDGELFLPGLPYFVGAAVLVICLISAWRSGLLRNPTESAPQLSPGKQEAARRQEVEATAGAADRVA